MNKKELIKFINRIPDTGPRGTDDIKKVLKMLVEESDSSDDDTPSEGSGTPSEGSSSDSSSSGCDCPEIEANLNASLDDLADIYNLKIGDTTYLLPGSTYIVNGYIDFNDGTFVADADASFSEAAIAFQRGLNVVFVESREDGKENYYKSVAFMPEFTGTDRDPAAFLLYTGINSYYWNDPDWEDTPNNPGTPQ